MTWKELAEKIAQMPEDQQSTRVRIIDPRIDEAYPVMPIICTENAEDFGLDASHPYLVVDNRY